MENITFSYSSQPDGMSLNKVLAIFHHKRDNNRMKVVEKDKVISGMLQDELNRCREIWEDIFPAFSDCSRIVAECSGKHGK